MLNHTYTSVKNANLVDCGKKQHVASQPSPLLKDNFLGEFRTELDKKKVLANLGVATDLSLEWEYIKGDIGRSVALMQELDSRTTYTSMIDGFKKTLIEGITYLETVIGGEQDSEQVQDSRLEALETQSQTLQKKLEDLQIYLTESVEIDLNTLQVSLEEITRKVNNITELIQVSSKEGNALVLISPEQVEEGTTPGLYVPDLSGSLTEAEQNIKELQEGMSTMQDTLSNFVTKDDLGGGDFDFVDQSVYDTFVSKTNTTFNNIQTELDKAVKNGEDGHVNTLKVNQIKKDNEGNIQITDSFEVTEGIPLDIRFVKENLEELYNIPVKVCYPGMGVIVNSLSALYILRKPAEGISLTQEYIADTNNWKCPEDLVTVALTKEAYDNLEEINPNVFYYVYEDEIKLTQEPKREEYDSDASFNAAWQDWVNSLKTLSQEYMSAAWGVDVENKLRKKASSQSVSILLSEINNIKGNGNNPSLESLNKSVITLQKTDTEFKKCLDQVLVQYEDIEQGRLVDVEKEVVNVKNNLSNYVTKDYIQDSSNEFIFVKEDQYVQDQQTLKEDLSNQIETQKAIINDLSLSGNTIEVIDNSLKINNQTLAKVDDIPEITILSQEAYDEMDLNGQLDSETYYYTFDGDVHLITNEDLGRTEQRLQKQLNVLFQGGTSDDIETALDTIFVPIETWNKFKREYEILTDLVHSLEQRILQIEISNIMHTGTSLYISGNPDRCYYEEDTVYIESDILTFE